MPKRPKPLTLSQEAEALGFELDNLLTTEFSAQLTAKSELRRARALIQRLRARVVKADGLLDGYSLNARNGSASGVRAALDAIKADTLDRFPLWRKRKMG